MYIDKCITLIVFIKPASQIYAIKPRYLHLFPDVNIFLKYKNKAIDFKHKLYLSDY